MTCPSCHRPIAVARPRCLYCGAALPEEIVAALRTPPDVAALTELPGVPASPLVPAAPRHTPADRALVLLDLTGADPAVVARALGVPVFEAGQRVRRGAQVHRIGPAAEAQAEAARLAQEGLAAVLIAESAIREATPLYARGGHRSAHTLVVRIEDAEVEVSASDLVLVVRGPITREYQASAPAGGVIEQMRSLKRLRLATLEQGYRFHLHRRDDPRPIELNPDAFDFGAAGAAGGSTLLALAAWVDDLSRGARQDDGFRLLAPVLAVSTEGSGLAGAMRRRNEARGPETNAVLDNAAQFRFYSAWRGILERHRSRAAG